MNGVFNSIFVHGNMLGDAMFYGSGAGKLPTASAVVGDVIEEVRNLDRNLGVMWTQEKLALEDMKEVERRFFVRMKGSLETMRRSVDDAFGAVQYVRAEGLEDEFRLCDREDAGGRVRRQSGVFPRADRRDDPGGRIEAGEEDG